MTALLATITRSFGPMNRQTRYASAVYSWRRAMIRLNTCLEAVGGEHRGF